MLFCCACHFRSLEFRGAPSGARVFTPLPDFRSRGWDKNRFRSCMLSHHRESPPDRFSQEPSEDSMSFLDAVSMAKNAGILKSCCSLDRLLIETCLLCAMCVQ